LEKVEQSEISINEVTPGHITEEKYVTCTLAKQAAFAVLQSLHVLT